MGVDDGGGRGGGGGGGGWWVNEKEKGLVTQQPLLKHP